MLRRPKKLKPKIVEALRGLAKPERTMVQLAKEIETLSPKAQEQLLKILQDAAEHKCFADRVKRRAVGAPVKPSRGPLGGS